MGIRVVGGQSNGADALAYLIGSMLGQGQQRGEMKDANNYLTDQTKTLYDPSVTNSDTTQAQAAALSQIGRSDLLGQDGSQAVLGLKKQWDDLDNQEKQTTDQATIKDIQNKKALLTQKADAIRGILTDKGADVSTFSRDANSGDAATKLASILHPGATEVAQTSTQPPADPTRAKDLLQQGNGVQGQGQAMYAAGSNVPGLITQGNIDLSKRPVLHNADGSISTVRSVNFDLPGGKQVLLSTVGPNGEDWTPQQALENYKKTGQHLGIFDSRESAENYAQNLHKQQEQMYVPQQGQQGQQAPAAQVARQTQATQTPAQNPYMLTYGDLAKGTGITNAATQNLAQMIAKQRANSNFSPQQYLSNVSSYLLDKGVSKDTYDRVMGLASQRAAGIQSQINTDKVNATLGNMQKAIQSGDNRTALAYAIQLTNGDATKAVDIVKANMPDYTLNTTDTGGNTIFTKYAKNGMGPDGVATVQNTVKPDTLVNARVSLTNNTNDNNTRLQVADLASRTAIYTKKMESANKDEALAAAKEVIKAAGDFDENNPGKTNPYAASGLLNKAQAVLDGKLAGNADQGKSGKITDEEYDKLYNKLVFDHKMTPEQAQEYIKKNYW